MVQWEAAEAAADCSNMERLTVISHALAGGRTLAEVKAAAGHASLLTTSVYLHIAVEDEGKVGDLFCFAR